MSADAATLAGTLAESMAQAVPPPATFLDELLDDAGLGRLHPLHDSARLGLEVLVRELLAREVAHVDVPLVDFFIAELSEKMARQIDEILHHPIFQRLEAAWRGLRFVVDRVDFRENLRVEMLNASKEDLRIDFEDSPEIPKSGMYRLIYSAEYGVFGGKPFGLIVGNYMFDPLPQDIALLSNCAAVATMSHAPFIAGVGSRFFGVDDFLRMPHLKDLASLFEGPQYTKWRAFRATEDARYVGLCLPRFLLRLPYGNSGTRVRAFHYEEDVVGHHERYLWGNAAFAFATRVADSFAKYRWCLNIIGPQGGGTVEELPLHEYEALGAIQTRIPTEVLITERREWELSEEGFISFTVRRETENACFFSANSTQKVKTFGLSPEGKAAELNFRLGTQLPYLFVTCRLAHYIKVMQREQIGTWKERQDLERELNRWIMQYVAQQEVISAQMRARRPLREAHISVTEVPGAAGWYRVDLRVRPHFKYMGAQFQLGLMGRLDKE